MIKLKRRIGSAFLACMMLLSLLPVTALAAESANNEMGISYSFEKALREALGNDAPDADAELTIKDCQKLTGILDLSNKGITEISNGAIPYTAKGNLPEAEQNRCVGSVWAVSNLARALNNVTELDLSGNNIIAIPSCFLMGSPSITKVILPDTVKVIGLTPVASGGTHFIDSAGNTYNWGYNAFSHMKSLTTINIPDSVEYLADYSFAESINLEYNIENLPTSLKTTGVKVFDMHESIRTTEEITYDDVKVTGNIITYLEKNPDVEFGGFFFEATKATADAAKLVELDPDGVFNRSSYGVADITGELVIPEGTNVSNYAFDGWEITSAVIPSSVALGTGCFSNNDNLKNITVQFDGTDTLDIGELPDNVVISYEVKPSLDDAQANGAALTAAVKAAKDGDTIVLTAGTYELDANECIILNKKLTIQGTGEDTIIKGSSTTDYGNGLFTFTGGSEGSVLKDLTIEYTSTGAQCSAVYFNGGFAGGDDNNVTKIQNVNFVGGSSLESIGKEMAITSTYTKGGFIEITGCSFENFAYAMYFNAIHDLTIADNTIDGTKYNAINIAGDSEQYGCSNIVIRDNVLTNISYANYDVPEYSSGIRIGQNVSSVTLENNDITMLNGKDGIFFDEGGNAHVATFMNMGNVVQMAMSDENGEVTMPAAPSRAGYSFRGWYDGHNLYAAGQSVQITEDTTFVAQWSDNTPYYTITVKDAANGTVTCYAKSAAKGADVTLNVKADVGYQLDKLTVTDASGKTVAVEKVNNTTYTFVMPGSKVTVEAVFAPTTVEPSGLPFTDVSTSDWFYDAVKFVYENGLMDGVGNNLFAPNATLNRAMAVTILYRLEGSPALTTDAGFNDVAAGIWYTDAVNWAAANNIVNGVEGNNFDPTGSLTREQMATVLYRYAQYKGVDVSASGDIGGFVDSANVSSWAADAVKWAVGTGLVNGVEGNALAPQGTSTRAQAATVLMRFVG